MSSFVVKRDINILLESLNNYKKILIVTDKNIHSIYSKYIESYLKDKNFFIHIIDGGETNKNKETVFSIFDSLIEYRFTRNDLVIAFGGGVVGDLAGFVASTYMRGLDYIQIPTSLLAQVDSSVGGKTGFDYGGYKNIIGSFKKPSLSYIDSRFLLSLSDRDMLSGLGEVLKYGLIYDYDFFLYSYENKDKILSRDLATLDKIIEKSLEIKNIFVEEDFRDENIRKKLNFGHTIGHALESHYGFKKYSHGEAVILGMIYESYIGYLLGLIGKSYMKDIYLSLSSLVEVEKFNDSDLESIFKFIKMDKKNEEMVNMVLPIDYGKVELFKNIDRHLIYRSLKGEWIEDFRK